MKGFLFYVLLFFAVSSSVVENTAKKTACAPSRPLDSARVAVLEVITAQSFGRRALGSGQLLSTHEHQLKSNNRE